MSGFRDLGDSYTCESCGGTFSTNPAFEEKAKAEARKAFSPDELEAELSIVCEPCWRFLRALQPELEARYTPIDKATIVTEVDDMFARIAGWLDTDD